MPPKFPWKTAALVLIALIVMGSILVTMWPGLRKAHTITLEEGRTGAR